MHHTRDACRGQKRISEILDLGTQVVVRYLIWDLGNQLFKEQNLVHRVYLFDTFSKTKFKRLIFYNWDWFGSRAKTLSY